MKYARSFYPAEEHAVGVNPATQAMFIFNLGLKIA